MSDKAGGSPPKDPATMWRDMLGDWEKNFNAFANKAMEQEDFAKAMHTATGAASGAKSAFSDSMQRYLTAMNLPSRSELTDIGERLKTIETQLVRLTHLVEALAGDKAPASDAPKPSRNRQPPRPAGTGGDAA